MQPYTHFVIGGALGACLFPNEQILQLSCAVGGVIPDLAAAPQYAIDLIAGRKPMTKQSDRLILLKEISHSLPIWILAVIIIIVSKSIWPDFIYQMIMVAMIGWFSHIPVDAISHNNPKFAKEDLTLMWPLGMKMHIGNWDYRYDYGVLKPKPFELFLCVALIILVAIFNVVR